MNATPTLTALWLLSSKGYGVPLLVCVILIAWQVKATLARLRHDRDLDASTPQTTASHKPQLK